MSPSKAFDMVEKFLENSVHYLTLKNNQFNGYIKIIFEESTA